jgi:hypothetical protein
MDLGLEERELFVLESVPVKCEHIHKLILTQTHTANTRTHKFAPTLVLKITHHHSQSYSNPKSLTHTDTLSLAHAHNPTLTNMHTHTHAWNILKSTQMHTHTILILNITHTHTHIILLTFGGGNFEVTCDFLALLNPPPQAWL